MAKQILDAFEVQGNPGQYRSLQPLTGSVPPVEFRLFFKGENATTKGTFIFDEVSAKEVVDIWQSRGIDLMGDYEHMSLVHPPIIAPASARRFDLEVRDGELWATNIKWTDKAAGYISAGEYRYYSAAFDIDPEEMRILRFINFALTNTPAADHLDPLVQARIAAKSYDPEGYALALKRKPIEIKKQTKVSDKKALLLKPTEKTKSLSENRKRKMAKFGEKIEKHMDKAEMDKAALCKACGLEAEEMDKMLGSEDAEMAPEHAKVLDKMAKALSMPVEHLCAMAMGHDPDEDGDDDSEDGEDEDEDKKEMKALKSVVIACTGKTDMTEAKAVLAAMRDTHEKSSDLSKQVVSLSAEIAQFRGDAFTKDFDQLVSKAKEDGKLSPSEIKNTAEGTPGGFLQMCREDSKNGLKSLRAYLSALSPKVKTLSSKDNMEPAVNSALTAEEESLAVKLGIKAEDLLATKKRLSNVKLSAE